MRIFGIDPGTAITGFGVIDVGAETVMVDAGVVRTPSNQALEIRLSTIYENLTSLLAEHRPDEVAIEELYFASNVKTAISVAQARGVAVLAAVNSGVVIAEYTPLEIKQAITGYGRAEKQQIQEMVRVMLKLKSLPRPDDAADALAVAITHSQVVR